MSSQKSLQPTSRDQMKSDWTAHVSYSAALALVSAAVVFTSTLRADEETQMVPAPHDDYAILVSEETAQTDGWKQVVSALRTFHRDQGVETYTWQQSPLELRDELTSDLPQYVGIVARPEELGRPFFLDVRRLVRSLDDDPWPDVQWGIVTGRTWETAMRNVVTREPLVIRRAAAGTSLPIDQFDEVIWWDEGVAGRSVEKQSDGTVVESVGTAADTMPGIVSSLNVFQPDLFFSSGRATQNDWRVGYEFKAGAFKVRDGALVGIGLDRTEYPVDSKNPKVWLAAGNCLLGDVESKDSMALAILGSAGATQFAGYGGVTWYGRAGWGTSDWFLSDPGRWNLTEAFMLNQVQLLHELIKIDPQLATLDLGNFAPREDEVFRAALETHFEGKETFTEESFEQVLGHLWDRDVMIMYGDPAWDARLAAKTAPAWDARVHRASDDRWHVVFTAEDDVELSRPPAVILPHRLRVRSFESQSTDAIVSDTFVMLPDVRVMQAGDVHHVVIEGEPWELSELRTVRRTDQETAAQVERIPETYRVLVADQLERAGENRGALVAAIEACDSEACLRATGFLLAYMPERDLQSLSTEFLTGHVREALLVRTESPYCRDVPEDVFLNEVLPYAFVGERREAWRTPLREAFMEMVLDVKSQEAAVKLLNDKLWKAYGITYHPSKRPKTDQSPSETIDCGVASCTGLSIILADACRAVGIPARLAGVPMWHNNSGNHTWIEVWDDGRWHFIEAFSSDGYDRAWWSAHAHKADGAQPRYAVWATSYKPTGSTFPLEWDPSDTAVPAVNVTERYQAGTSED